MRYTDPNQLYISYRKSDFQVNMNQVMKNKIANIRKIVVRYKKAWCIFIK